MPKEGGNASMNDFISPHPKRLGVVALQKAVLQRKSATARSHATGRWVRSGQTRVGSVKCQNVGESVIGVHSGRSFSRVEPLWCHRVSQILWFVTITRCTALEPNRDLLEYMS